MPRTAPPQTRLALAWRILRLPLIALGVCLGMLVGCQSRLIYFPKPYRADLDTVLPKAMVQLAYTTGQGRQVAFWLPPRNGAAPSRVWLCHGGNGSMALDWLALAQAYPAEDTGFLLVDYPGYGRCEGSCTPGRILANSEGAVAALAQHLTLTPSDLAARMNALGHSLGAACVLQYAARHPVQRVVLVSPFTSMVDMGNRMLCWPLGQCVWHRFDNRARLDALSLQSPPPSVVIIHGECDEMIPVHMGRELAQSHPALVLLHEIPNGDHNGIIDSARDVIMTSMMELSGPR